MPRTIGSLHVNSLATFEVNGPICIEMVAIGTKGSGGNTLTLYDGDAVNGEQIIIIDTTDGKPGVPLLRTVRNKLTAVCATGVAADVAICYSP